MILEFCNRPVQLFQLFRPVALSIIRDMDSCIPFPVILYSVRRNGNRKHPALIHRIFYRILHKCLHTQNGDLTGFRLFLQINLQKNRHGIFNNINIAVSFNLFYFLSQCNQTVRILKHIAKMPGYGKNHGFHRVHIIFIE